jgi:DNA-binding transcriptional LysR family regulator
MFQKRLHLLLRDFEPEPAPVQFVHPAGRRMLEKLRAFIDYFLSRVKSSLDFEP